MKAGAAERDITPPVGFTITHPPRKSVGVNDPLFIRALVLDDEAGTQVAIMCSDLIGMGFEVAQQLTERIRREVGIECVLLNCSHIHSSVGLGPRSDESGEATDLSRWNDGVHDAIVEMFIEARDSARPARLRAGRAPGGVGVNRRMVGEDGGVVMVPNYHAPAVPWVNVLVAEDADSDKPIALLMQHTAHPVIAPDDIAITSADFPGAAVAAVRRKLGDGVIAMFGQGCCGNINGYPLRTSLENAAAAGEALAAAALVAMRQAEPIEAETLTFRSAHGELPACDLPSMAVWQEAVDSITAMYERHDNPWLPEDVYNGRMKGFESLKGYIDRGDSPPPWRMDAYALSLGDEWCLVAMPHEMFCQYELWIDQAAPFTRTMTFGYTNGGTGYVAVDEAWAMGPDGGYEAACLPNWGGNGTCTPHFGPPAVGGEQIVKDIIAALWES